MKAGFIERPFPYVSFLPAKMGKVRFVIHTKKKVIKMTIDGNAAIQLSYALTEQIKAAEKALP